MPAHEPISHWSRILGERLLARPDFKGAEVVRWLSDRRVSVDEPTLSRMLNSKRVFDMNLLPWLTKYLIAQGVDPIEAFDIVMGDLLRSVDFEASPREMCDAYRTSLELKALRIEKMTGDLSGAIADAKDPDGDAGEDITDEERAGILGPLRKTKALIAEMEEQVTPPSLRSVRRGA